MAEVGWCRELGHTFHCLSSTPVLTLKDHSCWALGTIWHAGGAVYKLSALPASLSLWPPFFIVFCCLGSQFTHSSVVQGLFLVNCYIWCQGWNWVCSEQEKFLSCCTISIPESLLTSSSFFENCHIWIGSGGEIIWTKRVNYIIKM